jgi:cytidyltransferase-like protein
MILGIVSGYFNPVHAGHIEYMNEARNRCDYLIAIINNDKQVELKGSTPFMDENHRSFIVHNLKAVDSTMLSVDKDKTVCESIRKICWNWPNTKIIFFNSGDRVNNSEGSEVQLCKMLDIEYVSIPLPKKFSSHELIHNAAMKV